MLYIVSTPIGNLEDITLRALNTLKEVDFIACEDTRHSGILLKKYEIEKEKISFHSHSGFFKVQKIIDRLKEGESCALISDAGTPGISDPAYALIQEAVKEGIEVRPVPGPAAFLAALTVSALPINNFLYLGFLPAKKGRQTLLKTLSTETRTMVLYESPHRLLKSLEQFKEFFGGDRKISISRELTKIYEETLRLTLSEAIEHFQKKPAKGEFVICIQGWEKKNKSSEN